VYCPIHENTPGPTMFDGKALSKGQVRYRTTGSETEVRQGKLTLTVIREQLKALVGERAQTDTNLHYLDGTRLYGADDHARLPLQDELHPDAGAHRQIGERFSELVLAGGIFGRQDVKSTVA